MKKEEKISEELRLKALIDSEKIPRHVAVIMDGNGRWAKKRYLPRIMGHRTGVESVHVIVDECVDLGIEALTLYAFSVENWRRPQKEVSFLMKLLVEFLKKDIERMNRNNVRFMTIGETNGLPDFVQREIENSIKDTAGNTGTILNLALNYSSQVEISETVKKIAARVLAGELDIDSIDPDLVTANLYTARLPEVDLLIRTSGEWRISNFLLWQLAYSEIYITDTFWPDFREKDFYEAIIDFQKRERRFGKTGAQISKEKKKSVISG